MIGILPIVLFIDFPMGITPCSIPSATSPLPTPPWSPFSSSRGLIIGDRSLADTPGVIISVFLHFPVTKFQSFIT